MSYLKFGHWQISPYAEEGKEEWVYTHPTLPSDGAFTGSFFELLAHLENIEAKEGYYDDD
jgi:hypothetical protein